MGGNNNKRTSTSSTDGGSKSGLPAFPMLFSSLGWLLAAILFCFIYIEMRFNVFYKTGTYREGISSSNSNASGALASSVIPTFSMEVEDKKQFGSPVWEHPDADYPAYCEHREFTILSEAHLLDCAARLARQRLRNSSVPESNLGSGESGVAPSEERKIAFMFITRGPNPHEQLWKRFFKDHENLYSLYAHTDPSFRYENTSIFYEHQIPSRNVHRLHITLIDALRRLLAYAILDPKHGDSNWWFVLLCESTIPLRSLGFTHKYLMESQHSFVESFLPRTGYLNMDPKPYFERNETRKGELWMAVHLRHAALILNDWNLYYLFKERCVTWCVPDEHYIPTLLALKDPMGIENRTVMYVYWNPGHIASPFLFREQDMPGEWFKDLQERTSDKDGMYHDTSLIAEQTGQDASRTCHYNGIPESACFLFARKIDGGSVGYIDSLPASVLGY